MTKSAAAIGDHGGAWPLPHRALALPTPGTDTLLASLGVEGGGLGRYLRPRSNLPSNHPGRAGRPTLLAVHLNLVVTA